MGETRFEGDVCPLLASVPILHSCAPGLACVDDGTGMNTGQCLKWCTPPGQVSQCTGGKSCFAFPSPIQQAGTEFGGCL
jgi:hypothetical protein